MERVTLVCGTALLVAGLMLVVVVLPAEFGVDPLGVGKRLGLTAMSDVQKKLATFEAARAGGVSGARTVVAREKPYRQETVAFTLGPGESIEYKYRLDQGQVLLYSWKATGRVNCEFHAEPDGAPRGYAETYEKIDAVAAAAGTLTAPFSGIHGWFWENRGAAPVTVTLSAAGFYNMSHEFRKDAAIKTKMF